MAFSDLSSIDVLGARVKDVITGFTGIAMAMSERTFRDRGVPNVKQVAIQCEELIDGKPLDEQWFHMERLEFVAHDMPKRGFNPPPVKDVQKPPISPTGQEAG